MVIGSLLFAAYLILPINFNHEVHYTHYITNTQTHIYIYVYQLVEKYNEYKNL